MSRRKRSDDPIAKLSFVGDRKNRKPGEFPRCWWHVKPSGDYGADCELGTRLGLEYLAFLETHERSCLQHIVRDMPRKLTGVEIGFLTMVSYAAGAGADRAREIAAYWDRCEAERRETHV